MSKIIEKKIKIEGLKDIFFIVRLDYDEISISLEKRREYGLDNQLSSRTRKFINIFDGYQLPLTNKNVQNIADIVSLIEDYSDETMELINNYIYDTIEELLKEYSANSYVKDKIYGIVKNYDNIEIPYLNDPETEG